MTRSVKYPMMMLITLTKALKRPVESAMIVSGDSTEAESTERLRG